MGISAERAGNSPESGQALLLSDCCRTAGTAENYAAESRVSGEPAFSVQCIEYDFLRLQPIVENAVRYGISRDDRRMVNIQVQETADGYQVCICDKGKGIPQDIRKKLAEDAPMGSSIGLGNVHRRMEKLYGEDNGLQIISIKDGIKVELNFFRETVEGKKYEDGGNG